MPSASSQSSMQIQAPMEKADAAKAVLSFLEKKLRNLEKRKTKLSMYKTMVEEGKELNEDQKLAVGQLNRLEQNVEFFKEIQKNLSQVCTEQQMLQKKLAKSEQAAQVTAQRERDISRVCQVLELQSLMDNLSEDVRVDFLNGTNGAVVVTAEKFVQIDDFYKLITPNPEEEKPMKEQQLEASQHIVKFLNALNHPVVGTTYRELNKLVTSIKSCGYFEQEQAEEEEEAAAEEEEAATVEDSNKQEGSVEDDVPSTEDQTNETTDGSTETHLNGGSPATSDTKDVATFASNEHGLNFLSESEVESKQQQDEEEPQAPVESQPQAAASQNTGISAQGVDEEWVEQGNSGYQENDSSGFNTVQHSNGFPRGGRGGRGYYRRGDGGFNRRGGPPGERGNRRGGRGGYGGPPRGGRGGFGQQQDNYQRSGRGGRGGPFRGGRGAPRGRGPPQQ